MVELCELNVLEGMDEWPADMHDRVANLDFGHGDSLFGSVLDASIASLAYDPALSTDSLDSEQLRARCMNNKDDYKLTFADSGQWQSGQFTTWGRIKSAEPLGENATSAPSTQTSPTAERTGSLLEQFGVTRGTLSERFVDVNDNNVEQAERDRWRPRSLQARSKPPKPRRTFADLEMATVAPELRFLALPHKVPELCESSTLSLSDALVPTKRESLPPLTSDMDFLPPTILQEDSPDSGLGCSGPTHIEDWPSLSVLLPKHVADACSFFKSNSQLLGGSSSSKSSHSNDIDKPRRLSNSESRRAPTDACRTCFRVVRRRLHPPSWAQSTQSRHVLCDCSDTDKAPLLPRNTRSQLHQSLHPRELSIVGLPIYSDKRRLVEACVEGVAAVARGDGSAPLVSALTALLADGLKHPHTVWNMIVQITAPGPATKDVHSLVVALDNAQRSDDERLDEFFGQLLSDNSLDPWLCYVMLKENVLKKVYCEGAFLLRAPSAYRSLLWRLVESLELLSVLDAKMTESQREETRSQLWASQPCRLAADSRVPKSSSVPARLASQQLSTSRIPRPVCRPSVHRTVSPSMSVASPLASILCDSSTPGELNVQRGERVRVLSRRGETARVCRLTPRREHVMQGVVRIENLAIM